MREAATAASSAAAHVQLAAGSPRRDGRPSARRARARGRSRRCAVPAATSLSTSTSRAVSSAGFACVAGRGPRGTRERRAPGAPVAAASRRARRRAARTRRAPRGARRRRPPRRARAPLRTGRPRARHASAAPCASPPSCSRYGSAIQSGTSSSAPAFHCQYASSPGEPEMPLLERELVRGRSPPSRRSLAVTGEPRRLGARRPHVTEALQVAAGQRQLERLVEHVQRARVAAAGAHAPERDQRRDRTDRTDGPGQHVARDRRRPRPTAPGRRHRCEPRSRIGGVEVVLLREGDVLAQPALRPLELVHLAEARAEHHRTRTPPGLETVPARDVEAAIEVLAAAVDLAGHHVRGPDQVERHRARSRRRRTAPPARAPSRPTRRLPRCRG